MHSDRPSVSALIAAYARGWHVRHDAPLIFADPPAADWFSPEEDSFFRQNLAAALTLLEPGAQLDEAAAVARVMQIFSAPITLSRARYAEDLLKRRLADPQPPSQYMILGAGYDTFAWRTAQDKLPLRIFECDHPATQADKRGRVSALGWTWPETLQLVPVELGRESLRAPLLANGFDPNQKTFCSWLGLSYYLSADTNRNLLRELAALTPSGSWLVFDFLPAAAFTPEGAAPRVRLLKTFAARMGEAMQSGFDPAALSGLLAEADWDLVECLDPGQIEQRYFAGRSDGYRAFDQIHFALACRK